MSEFNIEDLKPSSGAGFDVEKYDGTKTTIEKVTVFEINSEWDYAGVKTPGVFRPKPYLKVETGVLEKITKKDGNVIELRASEIFPLKRTKDGKTEWSTHENAKIQKLFRRFVVNNPKELQGKQVVVAVRVTNTGKFLGFNY